MKETRALHIDSFPEKEVEREREKEKPYVRHFFYSVYSSSFRFSHILQRPLPSLNMAPAEKQRANFISEKPPRPRIFPP